MTKRIIGSLALGATLALLLLTPRPAQAAPVCDSASLVCTEAVRTLWFINSYESAGASIQFSASNLQPQPGGAVPDSVVFVLSGYSSWAQHGRTMVAYDNDSGLGYESTVTFTIPSSGWYTFFVASYSADSGGYADILIRRNGSQNVYSGTAIPFGTFRRLYATNTGDTFLAAKSPSANQDPLVPTYSDTAMLIVPGTASGTCTSNCGTAFFNNDDIEGLSRIDLTSGGYHTAFVGGVSGAGLSTRVFRLRAGQTDADGDGLPAEVESVLGTCDSSTSPTGGPYLSTSSMSCSSYASFINAGQTCPGAVTCWHARDTDHDGMTDLEEVYGLRRCYSGIASAPYHDAGPCVDANPADGVCDRQACASNQYETDLALSALDAPYPEDFRPPDPRHYDLLVEAGYFTTYSCSSAPSTTGHHHEPNERYLDQIRYTYEREGLECIRCSPTAAEGIPACVNASDGGSCCDTPATDCPNDPLYHARVHVFPKPVFQQHDDASESIGNSSWAKSLARHQMTPKRRESRVFRFAALTHGCGQAPVQGFYLTAANGENTPYNAGTLIHELGHTLGLRHNGPGGEPLDEYEVNYPSIMNYAYGHAIPLKDPDWVPRARGLTVRTCSSDADCTNPSESRCRDGYCMPACRFGEITRTYNWPIRFSRGALLTDETSQFDEMTWTAESGRSRYWLRSFTCEETLGDRPVRRRFILDTGVSKAGCNSTSCEIDFDESGSIGPVRYVDLNGRNGLEGGAQTDHDDWARLLRLGLKGLWDGRADHEHLMFYASFNAPDECDDSGTCSNSCDAHTSVWNRMGWQPSSLTENVQYTSPPGVPTFSGPRGLAAYFAGYPADDRIAMDSNGNHFDTLWNVIPNIAQGTSPALDIAPLGFAFRLWIRPDLTGTQTEMGLVTTDKFAIRLKKLGGPVFGTYNVSLRVGLQTTGGFQWYETCSFWTPVDAAAQGWIKVGVEFARGNGTNGTLTARYGTADSDGNGWVDSVPLGWASLSCQTAFNNIATTPAALGPVTIGQGPSTATTFRGFIDEVFIFNFPIGRWF